MIRAVVGCSGFETTNSNLVNIRYTCPVGPPFVGTVAFAFSAISREMFLDWEFSGLSSISRALLPDGHCRAHQFVLVLILILFSSPFKVKLMGRCRFPGHMRCLLGDVS